MPTFSGRHDELDERDSLDDVAPILTSGQLQIHKHLLYQGWDDCSYPLEHRGHSLQRDQCFTFHRRGASRGAKKLRWPGGKGYELTRTQASQEWPFC